MQTARLKLPASTSNLGPGFDTLGLALDWPLQASASPHDGPLQIEVSCPGPEHWRTVLVNIIRDAIREWEKRCGAASEGVRLRMESDIPLARGLGSSAAYRLGAVAAINAHSGGTLRDTEMLDLVCRLENHTDNTVPCMVGGLTVSGWLGYRVHFVRYPVPERYRFAALVPEMNLSTEEARKILPESVSRKDAVFNMQHALWLVNAIANDRPEQLRQAFADRLHQPFRLKLVPFLDEMISAAEAGGAFGAFLSGAGSTVIAVTDLNHADAVMKSMLGAAEGLSLASFARVLVPDNRGMQVVA